MSYSAYRPEGFRGRGDSYLPDIARQLQPMLAGMQRNFASRSIRLDTRALDQLAGILVDFGEDVYNRIGIWEAYERYNIEFFGTPLPLTSAKTHSPSGFDPDRIHHLLWVLYQLLSEGLILSPNGKDLRSMAEVVGVFLGRAFAKVPAISGVKAFLASSDFYGWDVKRKLIWLGAHSYMFRTMFARHQQNTARGKANISSTDDFVCQVCTRWSGLGVIDVLAGILDIPEDRRKDLRSWYERHSSFYKIVSPGNQTLQALNLISDQPYRIRINMRKNPFKSGQVVFGSLAPWRGEWYWSGEQSVWQDGSTIDVDKVKRDMKRNTPGLVCRLSKEYEAQVRQSASEHHRQMLTFHGEKDLIEYADGAAMAADWGKEMRWQWEQKSPQDIEDVGKRLGMKGPPDVKLPKDLLKHKGGLGVFLNPDEGKEIVTHFNSLIAGLRKKGTALTEEEDQSVHGLIESDAISPRFVRRLLDEYGDEAVKAAFLLQGDLPAYWLDYLLRSRKGQYYRRRYPHMAVV